MKKFFSDILGQIWTLVGLFVAWIVLEGSAKQVVGWLIIASTIIWIVSFSIRNPKD
jgi:hypothetical protein